MKVILVGVLLVVGLWVEGGICAVTPQFADVTAAKGFLTYEEIDLRNIDNKYWGTTVADINRDGVYDLWLCTHGNNPELYVSKPGGGYDYINPQLKFKDLHATAAADVDNDGYLDLFINLGGSNGNSVNGFPQVYLSSTGEYNFNRNNGRAIGIDDVPFRGRSMSFLDVNGDGCLDMLFINKRNQSMTYAHLMYENLCDGTFRLRNDTGMEQVNAGWHQIVDVNADSKPDILFLGFGRVHLWLGTGDFRFIDATDRIPAASTYRDCRTVAEIDYDNDGDMDLLFVRGRGEGGLNDILLENRGGSFVDVSAASGIRRGGRHYHVSTGDLNNDGAVDLYISVRASNPDDQNPRIDDLVLLNNGDKTFSRPAGTTGLEIAGIAPYTDGDASNIFDYNNDGKVDVLMGSRNDTWRLFENTSPPQNMHYILVRVGIPRAQVGWPAWFTQKALGALVKVFCGGKIMMARIGSPGQSHSQSYMDTIHLGLGTCTFIERIEVHYWHDIVVTRRGVGVDRMVVIGSYFPCPAGKLGRFCNTDMKSCNSNGCPTGSTCEEAELVRSRCDEQRCSGGSGSSELLRNGGFESTSNWQRIAAATYTSNWFFQGTSCMRLRKQYAAARQLVDLEANTEYVLTCAVLGGPVRYKVFKNGVRLAYDFGDALENIPGSRWNRKTLTFTTNEAGAHQIVFDTSKTIGGSIDNCSLKAIGCRTQCLKTFCPI